ncbi:Cystine/glutamate transporter [Taenia crassiceps]|uniref:Cystine/glutamate transporter n=1 Tax=Taenia crassiceps TaxID=6207 RepID=A0ABR4QKD1_9CEST
MADETWQTEMSSSDNGDEREAVKMKKEIGILQAVSIIFGVIVGSGIFVSPVGVLRYSNSVGLSLIMWIVPGLFSMLGALVYAELGVRIQKSGGEYAYILEAFGVIGGVSCAANSIVFAEYILQPVYPDCAIPAPVVSMIALCGLMLICAINCYKVKWATRVAVIFSFGKIVALLLIIGFGLYYLATGHVESFHNAFEGSNTSPGYLALAFYQGFWAFSGWNYLNFLVEEMENPGRNLPLAIAIGLVLVTGLYMLTNIAYLAVLTPYEMLATSSGSSAIAVVFAERAMPWISVLMPIFVGASVFGSINGEAMSMSRLTYTGAREGHMPSILAMIHHCNFTPIPAILVLLVLAVGYQFYSDLFALIELAGFAFSFIAALAVASLLYMRYKEPNLRTSFQLPIFFPILFLGCDLFILVLTIYQQPRESLSNVILMLAAVPIYWLGVSWKKKPKPFQDFIYKSTVFLQKVFACVPVENESQLDGPVSSGNADKLIEKF